MAKGNYEIGHESPKEVLNHRQAGEWYWQHEYAVICEEIKRIYEKFEF